jgi:hypothetical protein
MPPLPTCATTFEDWNGHIIHHHSTPDIFPRSLSVQYEEDEGACPQLSCLAAAKMGIGQTAHYLHSINKVTQKTSEHRNGEQLCI